MNSETRPEVMETMYLPAERSSDEEIREAVDLIRSHELAVTVLETMPGGAVVLDGNRQIVAASQALCDLLGLAKTEDAHGLRPGELLGCRVPDTTPGRCGTGEECRQCGLVNTVVESIQQGETTRGECRIALNDGGACDLAVGATARQIGDKLFVFVGLHDISGQKRREALERTFFHDVLNSAGGVQGLLECLKDAPQAEGHGELLTTIHALAGQVVDEIHAQQQLLAAENGDLVRNLKQEYVPDTIHGLVALYRHHDVGRGCDLEAGDTCDVAFETDRTILMRVLGNMIKNALEATPNGGRVVVGAKREDDSIVFSVSNPTPMPRDVQLQLFRRSFSTKGAGRGTGTYSMKLFGESYLGGKVAFTSKEEHGTTFTLRVPTRLSEPLPPGLEEELPAETVDNGRPRLKVLVVEDNKVNQLIARRVVECLGFDVDVVGDGAAAIEWLDRADTDVVLMDNNMPGMNGLDATRAIRELNSPASSVPIIALTAGVSEEERRACLDAGMNGIIGKPLSATVLRDAMQLAVRLPAAA